jgi:hypothetical protein
VPLVVADDDLAAVQQGGGVAGGTAPGVGVPGPIGVVDRGVVDRRRSAALGVRQVPDDDGDVAEPLLGQRGGEVDDGVLAGPGEGLAEDEVLGRIAGEGHLREDHEVRAGLGGLRRPPAHQLRVACQVTDTRVDLRQGHPQLHDLIVHRSSLVAAVITRPRGCDVDRSRERRQGCQKAMTFVRRVAPSRR